MRLLLTLCVACVAVVATVSWHRAGGARTDGESEGSFAAASQMMGDIRAYPDGIDMAALRAALRGASRDGIASPDSAWRSIGPATIAGRVLAIAVNPRRPTEVWAGTASGGLWKMIDSGATYSWQSVATGFPTQSVGAIYIDSANRDLIFIGTGEVYSYYRTGAPGTVTRTARGFYGSGIYYSTDNGATWNPSLPFPDTLVTAVNKIVANPRYTRSMYAATSEGIYKTYDQGRSWTKKLDVKLAMDIVINRIDTTLLFAACGDQDTPDAGIYRSTDAGEHWEMMNVVPTNYSGRSALMIYPLNPRIVFAGIADRFQTQGVYRSSDQGTTWTLQSTIDYTKFQGWYSNVVAINPLFNTEILAGGVTLWQSYTNGLSFIELIPTSYHVDIHAITFEPTDATFNTFYLGTDGGVYKTTDDGRTFHDRNSGLVTTQFYGGLAVSVAGDIIVGGTQDNGTLVRRDSTWQMHTTGDGSWACISDDARTILTQIAYINPAMPLRSGTYVEQSTDGGGHYSDVLLDTADNVSFTSPLVATTNPSTTVYLGTSFIWRSDNGGGAWRKMNGGQALDPFVTGSNPCIALAAARAGDTVYAATAPVTHAPGIFVSFDSGATWNRCGAAALPNRYPTCIAIDPRDAARAFVTYGGFGAGHLFATTDAGATWTDASATLPAIPTSAVAIDPADPTNMYVGNDVGVWATTDGGAHWAPFSAGLPDAIVMAITLNPATRLLRIATHGRGVYERAAIAPKIAVAEEAMLPQASCVYPTVVRAGMSRVTVAHGSGARSLALVDAAGQTVRLLQPEGTSTEIDVRALHAGDWFVRIRYAARTTVGRFAVVR